MSPALAEKVTIVTKQNLIFSVSNVNQLRGNLVLLQTVNQGQSHALVDENTTSPSFCEKFALPAALLISFSRVNCLYLFVHRSIPDIGEMAFRFFGINLYTAF